MEKEIKIKTKDKKLIYGTFLEGRKSSTRLVIFCHGFTGNSNEHILFNGASFFSEKGYDTFRFDLYGGHKNARHFETTSLALHGRDITTVVSHFKKQYKKIYLVGHSFGGPSIVLADTKLVDAIVLWDPSFILFKEEKKDLPRDKELDFHVTNWGMRIIIGDRFIEQLFSMTDYGTSVASVVRPTKVIVAGTGNKNARQYMDHLKAPKSFIRVPNADHCFNNHKAEKRLFEETYEWIKKW